MRPSGIVSLTTDFGLDDAYVAQLHAALLSAWPDVRVVDLSHAVPPDDLTGDLTTALFLTETAWPSFPAGTVHMVVVDPGVGSERGLVAIETPPSPTPNAWLVGPDTGVLSSGLPAALRPAQGSAGIVLPRGYVAADIRRTPLSSGEVSGTFHGRDLMAPVAAALASGRPLSSVGPAVTEIVAAAPLATPLVNGAGEGRILHVDRFGNAITSFRASQAGAPFTIRAGEHEIAGPGASYAAGGERPVALASSGGYLEIAWPSGNAAERLGIALGDRVTIQRA